MKALENPAISKKALQIFFSRNITLSGNQGHKETSARTGLLHWEWRFLSLNLEGRGPPRVSGWKLLGLPKAQLLKMYYLRS